MRYLSQTFGTSCFYVFFSTLLIFPTLSSAATANFTWSPNSESTIVGYKLYCGTTTRSYDTIITYENPTVESDGYIHGQADNLVGGTTYYFALTAYTDSEESDYTDEIVYTPAVSLSETVTSTEADTLASALYSTDESTTVSETVETVNNAPTTETASFSVSEDTTLTGQLSASDIDGDSLSYSITTQPTSGSVTVDESGAFSYSPGENYNGTDSFVYLVNDDNLDSNASTITIEVTPVNDTPTAEQTSFSTNEDITFSGQLSGYDVDGDTLTFSLDYTSTNGNVVLSSDGSFTYIPAENWSGADIFYYSVSDGTASSENTAVSVTVLPVNDAPVAASQSISVDAGSNITGQLTAEDIEGDPLTYSLITNPTLGEVTLSSDGTYSYTAGTNSSGSDAFSFIAYDGLANSTETTVSIEITGTITSFTYEAIEIYADSDWQTVTFDNVFKNPVVIAKATTFDNEETGVIRVRNITSTGCEIRFQEWDYLDDIHPEELVTVLVVEAGAFTLDDGTMVEAGCFPASIRGTYAPVVFMQTMSVAPVVIPAITSENENDAVTIRIRDITEESFTYKLQEQELNEVSHLEETACYLASEPSSGTIGTIQFEVGVTENAITSSDTTILYGSSFAETPFVTASQQTANGGDTAVLRIRNSSLSGMQITVAEEQSLDTETSHIPETAGYIALAPYNVTANTDANADSDGVVEADESAADTNLAALDDVTTAAIVSITVSGQPFKVKNIKYIDVSWAGATSDYVDIYRNGSFVLTTENDGLYTDGPFPTRQSVLYTICESETSNCSEEITVSW